MKKRERVNVINWKIIGLCVIVILLVCLTILLISYDNSREIGSIYRDNVLEGVAKPNMVIINEESKDKGVYLQNLGLYEDMLESFEIQMDSRVDSAYAVVILKVRQEKLEEVEMALRKYIISKQNYLSRENLGNLDKSRVNLLDTVKLNEDEHYVLMAMGENAESLMENTKSKLINT